MAARKKVGVAKKTKTKTKTIAAKASARKVPAKKLPEGASVKSYLAGLAPERRKDLEDVRRLVSDALPRGYEEGFLYGMISWFVPTARCSKTYNGQPLAIASLAAQKDYSALYLMGVYGDAALRAELEEAYRASGRKLDMGKSCLRFRSADELPSAALRHVLGEVDVDAFVAKHDEAHRGKRLKPVT